MRILLIITCLAHIAFAFGMIPWMPERMVTTWGLDGKPSGFMSPITSAVIMSVTVALTGAIILGVSFFMSFATLHMPESFNIPNRDYWLNEENRPITVRRICSNVELIGVGTMFFILFVNWELFRANQTVPPGKPSDMLTYAVGVLLAAITFDCVRMLRSFRLPKEKD